MDDCRRSPWWLYLFSTFFCCCHDILPAMAFVPTSSFLVVSHGALLQSPFYDCPRRHFTCSAAKKLDKGFFNLLETASAIVPQGKIVTAVSETWKFAWKSMMAELAPQDSTGAYQRPSYMQSVANAAAIGDNSIFPDQAGRYHVYTGNPCPWCHRVVLTIQLLGFTNDQIGWTVLQDNPRQASRGGWILSQQQPDRIFGGCRDLREIYDVLAPGYKGRCTAPLLVDTQTRKIVSNESADICRMLNEATLGGDSQLASKNSRINLRPAGLEKEIDHTNEWVYRLLNNGVYRCGFATSQVAYDAASRDVKEGLQKCEERLVSHDFLCGGGSSSQITEADVRLLPTMLRFDGVYSPLFKAGGTHLRIQSDYPAIHRWLRRCWMLPAVKSSIDLSDANASYYKQLFPLNPGGIVPDMVTAKGLGLE